jgi:DNA polymerase-3 subunit gamma/tau
MAQSHHAVSSGTKVSEMSGSAEPALTGRSEPYKPSLIATERQSAVEDALPATPPETEEPKAASPADRLSVAEEPDSDFDAAPAQETARPAAEKSSVEPLSQDEGDGGVVPDDLGTDLNRVFDVETLWPALVERVRKERSFISMWVESGVLEKISGGVALFVFAEEQSLAADYIGKDGHREFLEGVLFDLTRTRLKLRAELRETVQRRPVAQPPPPVKAAPKDPMEEFKNDPLIRKALELFKARLVAVQ